MADPLSIMGATTEAIGVTIKIVQFLRAVKHAKVDCQRWSKRLEDVRRYLEQLKSWLEKVKLDSSAPWYQNFKTAMGLEHASLTDATDLKSLKFVEDSPFGRLVAKLQEMEGKLKPSKQGWYHDIFWRIRYTTIKGNVAETFEEIDSLETDFSRLLQLDHFSLSEDTHGLLLQVDGRLASQQREKNVKHALNQLSTIDFVDRQNQVYSACFQDGSPPAQWFLASEEYTAWRGGRPWPLYCYGKPGAGKVDSCQFLPGLE